MFTLPSVDKMLLKLAIYMPLGLGNYFYKRFWQRNRGKVFRGEETC